MAPRKPFRADGESGAELLTGTRRRLCCFVSDLTPWYVYDYGNILMNECQAISSVPPLGEDDEAEFCPSQQRIPLGTLEEPHQGR
jgi:hypothetical protein